MIEVNIDRTNNVGKKIINKVDDLNSYVKQLVNIIDRIDAAWDGDDSLKYINNMKEEVVVELKKLNDVVEKYGQYLSTVPQSYEILDEIFSSKNIGV